MNASLAGKVPELILCKALIHLAKIKRLHLLRDFHKDIFIAPAVWREVVQEGREWPGSSEVEQGRRAG